MNNWRKILWSLFFVHVFNSAAIAMILPFLPLYIKSLGITTWGSIELWTGLIFSLPAIAMMLVSPLWGHAADHFGRKPMLLRSTIAATLVFVGMGFVQNAEQLAVLRLLQGLLVGSLAVSNALMAATIPQEKLGESFGFLRIGTWMGNGVGPLLGGLLGEYVGLRYSFWITGIFLFIATLLVAILIQEDFKPVEKKERLGFWTSYRILLKMPDMRSMYAISLLYGMGRWVAMPVLPFFIILLLQEQATKTSTTATVGAVAIMGLLMGLRSGAAAVFVRPISRWGDRIGHHRIIQFSGISLVILYFCQPFVSAPWQLVVLNLFVGIAGGGALPSVSALISICSPKKQIGAVFGLEKSIDSLARAIGATIGTSMAGWFGPRSALFFASFIYIFVFLIAQTRRVANIRAERSDTVPEPVKEVLP